MLPITLLLICALSLINRQSALVAAEEYEYSTDYTNESPENTTDTIFSLGGEIPMPEGITYSPFNDDGTCKNYFQISNDLDVFSTLGIKKIRLYANDCDCLSFIRGALDEKGFQIMMGIWVPPGDIDHVDGQVEYFIWQMKGADSNGKSWWHLVDTVLVGNEAILLGYVTPFQLLDKIAQVKTRLREAGFEGPVGTAEPPVSFEWYPDLCRNEVLDVVGINSHPYFAPHIPLDQCGQFVINQYNLMQEICPGKNILVVETGYPHSGDIFGHHRPSKYTQKFVIGDILMKTGGRVILFTAFDDYWKNPGPQNIEQSFGVVDVLADFKFSN